MLREGNLPTIFCVIDKIPCGIICPSKKRRGRVVWLSAHAWKACNPQRFAGSNPALSADGQTYDIHVWEVCPEESSLTTVGSHFLIDKLTMRYFVIE